MFKDRVSLARCIRSFALEGNVEALIKSQFIVIALESLLKCHSTFWGSSKEMLGKSQIFFEGL